MANLTSIAISSGQGSSGTGTVSTIDALLSAVGTPSSLPITVQPSTAAFNIGTITSLTSGTVAISSISGGTITSLSSGTIAIANAGNTAAVKAASTAPSSADPALVIALSPNGVTRGAGAADASTVRVTVDSGQLGAMVTGDFTKATPTVPVELPSDQAPIATKGNTVTQASSITLTPATTGAYASGQLVANSTTPASVTNLQFTTLSRVTLGSGLIVGAALQKTTNVTTNAAFRLHYFNSAPTYTSGGDHSALSTVVVASSKAYLGYVDIPTMIGFSDVAWGTGAPDNTRGSIPYVSTSQVIYALLEARSSYVPTSTSEVFLAYTMALQD